MQKLANFIHGEFVPPEGGKYLENICPATGDVYSLTPDSEAIDVVKAYQSARSAFEEWSQMPVAHRTQILLKVADEMEARKEELARAESRDQGKPFWLAHEVDMNRAILNFRFFANRVLQHQEHSSDMDGKALNYSLRQPIGVAGLISPWNLPLYLITWKIAPALAVGNTAICKPSELTPMTAYLLGEVFQKAGLPPGVCNFVHGRGNPVGDAIVTHPGIPLISFTGGTATGKIILEKGAAQYKKMGMELGGKNANIIFGDADLKKCIPMTLKSSFLNSGQICLCGSRLFVQESIYDEFVNTFVEETKKLKVGDPSQSDTFMGPVISADHLKKIKGSIDEALKDGGKLLAGDESIELPQEFQKGFFMRPTIIADLTDCSEIWQKEIFGPVITIRSFKYPHEAVKWANTSPYGLAASLWTRDLSRAHKVAAQLHAGTVWVNTWSKRDLRVPFGGMKESGLGREGGDYSIDFYTEQKNICIEF